MSMFPLREHSFHDAGISLREYLAARAEPADPDDLCELLGWPTTLGMGEFEAEQGDGHDWTDTFAKRWRGLTCDQRLKIRTQWAYKWADAMIAAGESNPARGGG